MVGGHPLSHEPVESHVRGVCSRSSSNHRGVPGDPNVSEELSPRLGGRSLREVQGVQRENLPPKDPIGPSSTQEQVPLPTSIITSSQQSSSSHSIVQSGVSQDTSGEVHCKGVMDHADLIEDAKFYKDIALDYQDTYEALHAQQVKLQGKYSVPSLSHQGGLSGY